MPTHQASNLNSTDWTVIACYALGMILVGWYYARQTRNTEDYLLGGRKMRPWAVGLSMFATLLSTLSYLSWPGEVIAFGPLILTQIAAYPLIFLFVGWLLIPFIMKLQVTTAYEILDRRFGPSIRLSDPPSSSRYVSSGWRRSSTLLPAKSSSRRSAGQKSARRGSAPSCESSR